MNTIKDFARFQDNFVIVHQGSTAPEISVVMPIYNCEKFVASAVISVLAQQGVTAEIIISDDASTDATFACAYKTVIDYIDKFGSTHTVKMRAGTQRLQRDHLHLLANVAVCDLICQAHGDDISHCYRCRTLVQAFNTADKTVSMIFVNPVVIDRNGDVLHQPKNQSGSHMSMIPADYQAIIDAWHELLIGGNMAWRRSALANFPPLTTAYCAYGHDRVMTWRSYLVGGCYILDAPLLKRRLHPKNFHKESISSENTSVNFFNAHLIKLCSWTAMKNDLIYLQQNQLIDPAVADQHADAINNNVVKTTKLLTAHVGNLVMNGYVNKWIKENGT